MKFKINNLGYIDNATIELGDLTVICGFNNTGKTYLSYALWGFFKTWIKYSEFKFLEDYFRIYSDKGTVKIDLKKHEEEIQMALNTIAEMYGKNIQAIFNISDDLFKNTKFGITDENLKITYDTNFENKISYNNEYELVISKKENSSIVELSILSEIQAPLVLPKSIFINIFSTFISSNYYKNLLPRPFIITSERTGISLFLKELDFNKNDIINKILKKQNLKEHDMLDFLFNRVSRYAEPIKSNVDDIRDLSRLSKSKSFLMKEPDNNDYKEIMKLWNNIIQGSYKVTENEIFFVPKKEINREKIVLPIYASSSAVKSLLLLDVYIKNIAQKGDILFIDEPELNLHPENQRKLADLFARLSNSGIKIFITTHSDYLMKELNNLIMLYKIQDKENLLKKYKYDTLSAIDKQKIKAYVTEDHQVIQIEVTDNGLETEIFDATALLMNQAGDDIYYSNK
jgi:predicted ATPase